MTVLSPMTPRRTAAIEATALDLGAAIQAAHEAGDGGATYRGLGARTGHPWQRVHARTVPLSGKEAKLSAPEELGPRIALAFHERRASALRAEIAPSGADLGDVALDVSTFCGRLAHEIREAKRDGHIDRDELGRIEAEALAAKSHLCAVLSECARLRAKAGGR